MSTAEKWAVAVATLLMVTLMTLIVFGDDGLQELSRRWERQRALAGQNETLAGENVDLYRVISRLKSDPAYIESVARNELGMVGKNDLIIIRSGAGARGD